MKRKEQQNRISARKQMRRDAKNEKQQQQINW